jgi:hypothetical protein
VGSVGEDGHRKGPSPPSGGVERALSASSWRSPRGDVDANFPLQESQRNQAQRKRQYLWQSTSDEVIAFHRVVQVQ